MARIVKQAGVARGSAKGSGAMKVKGGRGMVFVGRDSSGAFIELQTSGSGVMDQPGGVLLTRDEARRLAASILFESDKMPRRRIAAQPLRRSA
jgi:hypothetical protein